MKLYSRKLKRNIERQVHFGVGNGVRSACGVVLFSRHAMVSIFSSDDGALLTDDISKVTCKRCLATKENRLRKLVEIQATVPGIFDRPSLCGEDWLLEHGLDVSQTAIDDQKLELMSETTITLTNRIIMKDRKAIIRSFAEKQQG